jgi:spore coat protein CotH
MRRLLWTWIVGLVSIPLWAAEAQPDIEATRQFFAKLQIVRLDFQIGSQEMDSLRREPRVYVKAQLAENGAMTYKDVGVHLRGAVGSSRSIDDKAGLTINMDKFQKGQRFHGLDKWHLCNSVQDPSYVSEFICGEIMRDARVPAARISFAWVTINGRPRGLYYLKEAYDAQFLRTHIGHDEGNLYDGGFLQDLDANPKLIYSKNGLPDRKDLKVLVEAAREPDLNKRLARLHELLDMDRFLSYLCLEVIMHDWDGYPLNRNNFRIYHDIKRNKIVFIPSGMDQMFSDVNLAVRPPFNGMIARALVEVPEGKELYYKRMKEIITQEYKPLERVRRLEELAKFLQDGVRPFDGRLAQEIPHQINRLKQAIPERGKVIERQLKEREARQKK